MGACRQPCNECPFRKDNVLPNDGAPGGAAPEVYIGQALGPFWLPCHKDKNYREKESDPAKVLSCQGAADFRANLHSRNALPYILPANLMHGRVNPAVFEDPITFVGFYKKLSAGIAMSYVLGNWKAWVIAELDKARGREFPPDQKTIH